MRIRTIDVLRALTMFLMIFVNDIWSLTGIPDWLGHTAATEDGMGFSDVIFPLFLFIVGLSIPLAINVRLKKKDSKTVILLHILGRTMALLIMGFYMVNNGVINDQTMPIDKNIWQILMALGIFLIWMDYKRLPHLNRQTIWTLKSIGVLLLAYLAWTYQGGNPEEITGMQIRWWGILGLIGWAYFLNSILFLYLERKSWLLVLIFIGLLFLNIQENNYFINLPAFKLIISASNHALIMAGVLCTLLYLKLGESVRNQNQFLVTLFLFGIVFIGFGFILRTEFIISKIMATPSWTSHCIGISCITYASLFILVDRMGKYDWIKPIKPAGTSTLTCYLMPYLIYPVMLLSGFQWPSIFTIGVLGILKSLMFSLMVILIVGFMEKRNVRLKI
ncbi:DUF5009 domain-containing protein [Gelidibacter mesophilus]|uniref:DUF5009 domain-containing protein n=1 Tax=Gelidibacter mesophilus TaxID=169050 RepID=UPI0003FDFD66|nr:DUF5009 domain-containing protein [Gelidibacter mesophilus]